MLIKVLHQNETEFECYTPQEFEEVMGVTYLEEIAFQTPRIRKNVERRCQKIIESEALTIKQKWIAAYFNKEITLHTYPAVSIRWINEPFQYGVFADEELPSQTYIGEYTGVVRKRKLFGDKQNGYLFEYYLGEALKSKYIIDAEMCGNYTHFINHSDSSNVEPIAVIHGGVLRIIFYTKHKIAQDEQLTYDYGKDYWKTINKQKLAIDAQ